MEAERLQEVSGDKLDEEAKARRKKCAPRAIHGLRRALLCSIVVLSESVGA